VDKEAVEDELKRFALKQCQDEQNFIRESSARSQYDLSEAFVAQVLDDRAEDQFRTLFNQDVFVN
jgi:hypothetical protein